MYFSMIAHNYYVTDIYKCIWYYADINIYYVNDDH